MNILNYSHDRSADFHKESKKIFQAIENFGDHKRLEPLLDHFNNNYSLPSEVIKKRLKKIIALSYKYKSAKFDRSFNLNGLLFSFIRALLTYIKLMFCTIKDPNEKNNYKLIIDDVRDDIQLRRFEKLIKLFGKDNVLIIVNGEINREEFEKYNLKIIDYRRYNNSTKIISNVIWTELFKGIWICLKSSLLLRVNLFPIYISMVKSYYHYKCIFEFNKAEYLIQERHYNTNPIKNHLFKENGGIATTSIQKNLIENDFMFYYIDIDFLFSLGEKTLDSAINYGARIKRIIPVGSLFMEYYWFNKPLPINKNIDVTMLGLNIMNAYEREDKYDGFMDDYYKSIKWLVKFNQEYPQYKIRIKHHLSAGKDVIEERIISNSGVEIIPKDNSAGNSYHCAFNSNCVVTYGSTMGYEMIAHGVPSFFIDPGNRSTFLPDKDSILLENIRLSNYNLFREALLSVLDNNVNYSNKNWNNLCMESSNVSEKIFDSLNNNF